MLDVLDMGGSRAEPRHAGGLFLMVAPEIQLTNIFAVIFHRFSRLSSGFLRGIYLEFSVCILLFLYSDKDR